MFKHKNLAIIGTSHISKQSIDEIKDFFEKERPEIVCVELDKERLRQLFSKKEERFSFYAAFKVGLKGFLFAAVGRYAQKKLGEMVGMKPGSDMKLAVKLAKKDNSVLYLIDQDIRITLSRFSRVFGWKEKWNLIKDFFTGIFKRPKLRFDLKKVPSEKVIRMLLEEVRQKYPNIYRVLVTERNQVMAKRLINIMQQNPQKKILAVIGAGHMQGIKELIESQEHEYTFSYS